MKKILIISPVPVSFPPRDGYSMVVFYRSYFLKKFANIESDIIVPDCENNPAKNLIDSGVFNKVFSYPMSGKWISLAKSLFSFETNFMIKISIKKDVLRIIKNNIENTKYQMVIFDHSKSYAIYKKLIKHINIDKDKIIYWSHNIDYIDLKNITMETNNLLRKIFYYITYKKTHKIELEYIKEFTKIVSVSHHETKILKEINPKANVYWISPMLPEPNFIDIDNKYFAEIEEKLMGYKYKIFFTGILEKSSNYISVIWFANKIFPIIKNELNVCFLIAGKNPPKELTDLAKFNNDIFIFLNPSSVAFFYKISDLVIVPLFNPAGIKLKLIEALKFKKKVVARPEALLGARLEDIVVSANSPEEFAKKCIDVLEGKIDYMPIWQKFNQKYDNKKIINKLLDLI